MDARVVLNEDTSSAATARRFVRETLTSWELDSHVDTAMLLISELVTNAVLHARSGPEVVLQVEGEVVRIEVHDSSPVLPARRHYGLQAGTGRGIVLVEEMASDWGAEPTPVGKVVWFELRPGSGLNEPFILDAETLADLAGLAELDPQPRPGAGQADGRRDGGGPSGAPGPRAHRRSSVRAHLRGAR